MGEEEKKTAFRIAYDFLGKHTEPKYDVDYFMDTTDEIKELYHQNRGNKLLPFLLMGVYEYIVAIARERAEK